MKLKKGSKAAKDFMSKIRAKKGKQMNLSPFYKGINVRILSPSGYFEFYSDKQQRFIKADTKENLKKLIDIEVSKKNISGWKKGNTQILEVGEKPKIKNVRVKRNENGKFKIFKQMNGNVINKGDTNDFFEKNIQEYNRYNHLVIYRNFRGRSYAKFNNKIIALKKAYNLIDIKEYNFFNQIELGSLVIIEYRKLK